MKYNKKTIIGLTENQLERLEKFLENNKDTYESKSHFFRCAMIKLLREGGNNGR